MTNANYRQPPDGAENIFSASGDAQSISSLARQAMAKVVANTREQQRPSGTTKAMPQPHVTALALALADSNHALAEDIIDDLLDAGVTVKELCLDHLAPAARELGLWWKQDKLAFADVTLATARIQSVLRKIPHGRRPVSLRADKSAVFVSVPGETHTLGVIMAADHFRRLGWDVRLLIGMDHLELCHHIVQDSRALVAISCSGRHSMEPLRQLVDELRWQRPDISMVLSGLIARDETALASLPDFDGVVTCFDAAEGVLSAACAGRDLSFADARAQA